MSWNCPWTNLAFSRDWRSERSRRTRSVSISRTLMIPAQSTRAIPRNSPTSSVCNGSTAGRARIRSICGSASSVTTIVGQAPAPDSSSSPLPARAIACNAADGACAWRESGGRQHRLGRHESNGFCLERLCDPLRRPLHHQPLIAAQRRTSSTNSARFCVPQPPCAASGAINPAPESRGSGCGRRRCHGYGRSRRMCRSRQRGPRSVLGDTLYLHMDPLLAEH